MTKGQTREMREEPGGDPEWSQDEGPERRQEREEPWWRFG